MISKTEEEKQAYIEGAKALKGADRRLFMAHIVKSLGHGGQLWAHKELGWDRKTIRKGTHELESGITCVDDFQARGGKRAEEQLPNLLDDIHTIVDGQSQTDPTFRTTRLYTRISARAVREALLERFNYNDETLPAVRMIRSKLN